MTIGPSTHSIPTTIPLDTLEISATRLTRAARIISDLLSPPVFGAATLALIGVYLHSTVAWLWLGVFLVLAVFVPTIYVFWLVKRGQVTDFHIPVRSQRYRPMILMLFMALLSTILLWIVNPPQLLGSVVLMGDLLLVLLFIITLKWKISGHTLSVTTFALLCAMLYGELFWFSFLLIPAVVWARLHLRRHTRMQTLAGFAMGMIMLLAFI